jgi:hypothetical protein
VDIRAEGQRRFRGRLVRHQDGVLTIHFQVEGDDLVWRLGREVEVVGSDGARTPRTVREGTPPATVRAGEEIRLTIASGEGPPLPREVIIAGGPELVIVML